MAIFFICLIMLVFLFVVYTFIPCFFIVFYPLFYVLLNCFFIALFKYCLTHIYFYYIYIISFQSKKSFLKIVIKIFGGYCLKV